MDKNRRVRRIKKKMTEILEFPGEIVLDVPKMILTGNYDLAIENYKSIVEYTDNLIRLNTGLQTIKIIGDRLMIKSISEEEIVVTGNFRSIEFLN